MNVTDFADLTQNDAPAPAEAENRHPERGPAEGKQEATGPMMVLSILFPLSHVHTSA